MASQKVKEQDPLKLWNRVEELLAENYDLNLFDILPVGITLLDLKGVIVYCNPAVCKRSGYPNDEYIGKHFSKIASVRIKDIPKYTLAFSSIVMGKIPKPFETDYQRKDGTFGSIEVTISIMKIGGKRHILVILHDITERKKAEEALRKSNEMKDAILNATPDYIAVLDEKLILTDINERMAGRFGKQPEELIGKHGLDLLPTELVNSRKQSFKKVLQTGQPFRWEDESKGAFFDNIAYPMYKEQGRVKRVGIIARDITERRQAEEAFRESENRYRVLVEQSPIGVGVSSPDGRIFYANKAMSDITGYSIADFENINLADTYENHEDRTKMVETLKRYNKVTDYIVQLKRKDGTPYHAMLNIRRLQLNGEEVVQTTCIDITERKQAEEALRYERDFAQGLINTAQAVVVILDTEGRITQINPYMEEISGYLLEEVKGKDWFDTFLPERDRERIRNSFRGAIGNIQTRGNVNPIVTKDGKERDIEWYDKALKDSSGNVVGLLAMGQDITERKTLEENMARERQELSLIIDSSPIIVFYKNTEGRFIRANKAFAEALHITEEEFVGKTVFDLYSTNIAEIMTSDDREVLQSGHPKLGIVEQYESASGLRWVLTDKVPIFDANGFPAGLVGFAQDITERKQAELDLNERIKELRCLYDVANISGNPENTLDERYQQIADILPQGYQYSEITCVRITVNNRVFTTENYRETEWKQSIDIIVQGEKVGTVEVNYLEEKPEVDEGPFLKEERLLIDSVAERLGSITEHKRADEALRESYEYLERLGNSLGDAVFTVKMPERVIEWVNDGFKVFGYDADECIGKTTEFLYPYNSEFLDAGKKLKKAMTAGKEILYAEQLFIRKSGEVFPAEVTVTFHKEKDEVVGITSIIRDISERRKQERQRDFNHRLMQISNLGRELEPTLQQFVRAINDYTGCTAVGIRILDTEGNIPYQAYEGFSREFYETESSLSIKSDQCMCINVIRGDTDPSLPFYTEDGSFYMNGTTAFLATVSEEDKGSTRNECNKEGYESVALVPIHLGEDILGLIHVADQKTDMVPLDLVNVLEDAAHQIGLSIRRLWAEHELAEEKERLEVTLRSTIDGIIAIDTTGMVLLVNRAAEEMTGWTQKEAVGRTIREIFNIIDERNRKPVPDPVKNVLKAGRVIGLVNHAVLISRDGTERLIADSGAPIHDEHGRMQGVVLAFRDITESQKLQEEQARVAKLESIGTLAGGIAHDFNNLLTGIMGNIGIAKRGMKRKDRSFERLEEAEKAAVRAKNLTQQLLTFGRGGTPVKKLASISELIMDTATFALRGSTTGLDFFLPDDLWASEIDEGQISQVIHNIVINAAEAMPSGGTVNISASNVVVKRLGALPLPKGNYLRIDIEDEGIGMSKEQVTRIFEPYYTTKQKGSGLGLATAYSIIKNHGGYITIESGQNIGTTFHIYLPASEKPAPESEEEKEVMAEALIHHKGRILVMDDQEIIREMLSKMLPISGYQVELTGDGAEAIKKYADAKRAGKPFDAVIMDLTVPGGMGGREAIKKLLEVDPAAKVIVSSGYSTDPIISEYREHGFSAIINKPYSVSQMEETLRGILK